MQMAIVVSYEADIAALQNKYSWSVLWHGIKLVLFCVSEGEESNIWFLILSLNRKSGT